jgi:hypothetical protein
MTMRAITPDEWAAALRDVARSAFRLEHQAGYAIPAEADLLARWDAGQQPSPDDVPQLDSWFQQVTEQTARGVTVERVRVIDDPATTYQRFAQYCDPWNLEAGEILRYLSRADAERIGLLPAAGPADWWLLDDTDLIFMHFDPDGTWTSTERTRDPEHVSRACAWRDLAIAHTTPAVRSAA